MRRFVDVEQALISGVVVSVVFKPASQFAKNEVLV